MIKSFKHKMLKALWETGKSNIDGRLHTRILTMLDALDTTVRPGDMNMQGFNFHVLRGHKPIRYTTSANKTWRVTFEFDSGGAYAVDLEDYHQE